MADVLTSFDRLLADDGPAAVVLKQWLKPVGGDVFFPPTYSNPTGEGPVYNIDRFGETVSLGKKLEKWKNGQSFVDVNRIEHGRESSVCVVDSIPSQANRIEPAFSRIADGKLVPQIIIRADGKDGEQTINLLEAGHRVADAVVRFSSLASKVAEAIRALRSRDSTPLAKLAPTSLVFGMWDSRDSQVKVPRLVNSIIRAYDVREMRRSAQYSPAIDYEAAGVAKDDELNKASTQGLAGALATFQHGGIEARGGICRDASLNLCTLRDIVAKDPTQTLPLQRYILGLALVAITHFDGKTLNLRQGCQLVGVPDKPMMRTLVNADGTETACDVTRESALAFAIAAAKAFEVGKDRTDVTFDAKTARDALKPKDAKPKKGAKADASKAEGNE